MSINKEIFISFNDGTLLDNNGAQLLQRPQLIMMSYPTWNIHFVEVNTSGLLQGVDLSEAVSWHCAVDTDFLQSTQPLVRTLDTNIDKSALVSGIVGIPLDCATCSFFEKVDGKDVVRANCEIVRN